MRHSSIDTLALLALVCSLAWLSTVISGCSPAMESECHSSVDCPGDLFCKMGRCTTLDDPEAGGMLDLENRDAETGSKTDADIGPTHPCPEAPSADASNLVLTEFMANVPSGPAGDANEDGERHYHDDEFVELLNTSDETIDITGVAIFNDTDLKFTFDEYCLAPLHAVVVFGGLETGAEPPSGDHWQSLVSDTWFRYAQDGGRVVIRDETGDIVADVEYGTHPEGSLTLQNEPAGTDYVPHRDTTEQEVLFSPGTCADGRSFATRCDGEEETDLKPGD